MSSPFHLKSPHVLSCKLSLQFAIFIYVWVFFVFFFLPFCFFFCAVLFHWCWCCFCFFLIVSLCALVLALVFGSNFSVPRSPVLLGYIKPSGEPVVPRGPELSALSLRSSSCFSPAFPWCRPNPLAANGKPERRGHLSERQLRHRRRGGWLRQPVPHSAVLPVHRVALQQVRPRPPPWGRPGPVSISGQYPEGPKVRKKTKTCWISSGLLMKPFVPLPFHFHWTYWGPDSPN